MKGKLTRTRPIYLAIMAAFEARRGINLTAAEVDELGMDDAIFTRAAVCLEDDDEFVSDPTFTWTRAYAQYAKRRTALGEGS